MAQSFRLEVGPPLAFANGQFTQVFTPNGGNVMGIETHLKKEKHRVSVLTAEIYDPKRQIFNQLPDPAFQNVPVNFYMSAPDAPQSVPYLVFQGKVTAFHLGYPGPDKFTVVAHDNSIDMRKQKRYRHYKGLSSVQVAQTIANDYGLTVDIDPTVTSAVTILQKNFHFGPELSDWDFVARSLSSDGLELYVQGTKIKVRQKASLQYATTFYPDKPPVISFEASINWVHGPGAGGDKKGPVPWDGAGGQATTATAGTQQGQEFNAETASARTHRRPASGNKSGGGSHAEDFGNLGWTNQAPYLRRRKDTATLTCTALPDISLINTVNLSGWGGKVDGPWFINEIKQQIVGSTFASTTLGLQRAMSKGASTSSGVPWGG